MHFILVNKVVYGEFFFGTLDSACMGEVALTLTHFQVQPIPVENTAGTRLREVDDIDKEAY